MTAELHQHAANTAAKWTSLGPRYARPLPAPPGVGLLHMPCRESMRIFTTAPQAPTPGRSLTKFLAELGLAPGERFVLEDAFGTLKPEIDAEVDVLHYPVMRREPATLTPTTADNATVVRAHDEPTLAEAERVMVEGFPHPRLQGRRGALLPPSVLEDPGWRVWLAYDQGAPAAGGVTFDDGAVLGVYFMATLPGHRSRGLARAVLTTALATDPLRPATLVATDDGRALYDSLGFTSVGMSDWYISRS